MCIVPLVVFGEHRDNSRNSQSVFLVVTGNWSYRTKCVDENRFQALKIKG